MLQFYTSHCKVRIWLRMIVCKRANSNELENGTKGSLGVSAVRARGLYYAYNDDEGCNEYGAGAVVYGNCYGGNTK